MDDYFQRVSHPAMTDVTIDWGGMRVSDVYPQRINDLFVGRPVIVTGRYTGELNANAVRVTGRAGTRDVSVDVPIHPSDGNGIDAVWARMKIADLSNRMTWQGDPHGETASMIRHVALNHSLVSAYTAFVAVDTATRTAGTFGTTVPVPVHVPDGVRYETTVTAP